MARIKRGFVFGASVVSGIGVLFTIISLATEQWVYSDQAQLAVNASTDRYFSKIKYGLFQGTLRTGVTYNTVQISMTCIAKNNICAMLCAKNSTERFNILEDLYDNKGIHIQNDNECPMVASSTKLHNEFAVLRSTQASANKDRKFINFGVWISTIFFLSVSILFGLLAAGLSLYNTVSNPIQIYLSIYGIFIYNGIALGTVIIAVTVWGIFFQISIFHDIAIYYTLAGNMESDKTAVLGYSYWLNIVPIVLYIVSITLLAVREYMVSHDPKQKIVQREEAGDPVIYLY
ncbi:clarin-3 [Diabrotica virgifera virgifera]|uniref:Clarin-3-like n=1 Tax=Diabrotica virgifera virgifera TaxID=50390 RepID=A0A6P7H112_DIAVI|nr:clarin-3 [Diabrotica virgifera virgifera]